jgi:glycosyltransferase involved in cell wall biosynthesis
VRILVVADGLEPLLQQTVIGLADRGHRVRVIGASRDDELDPEARYRLSGLLRVSADRDRSRPRARAVRTAAAFRSALTRDRCAVADAARSIQDRLGSGRDFRHTLADVLPVLAEDADVVYFEAAYVASECSDLFPHLPPMIVMCTGSDLRIMPEFNGHLRRTLPTLLSRSAAVICRSHDLRSWALRHGADPERTTVLYPAVDLTMFGPPEVPVPDTGQLRLISVGRLHWVKGYEYAIQAVRLALDRGHDVTYTIVGADRGTLEPITIAIRDLGLSERVRLVGPARVPAVARALARHHAFVMSSVGEGVSRAALEAMAAGLPVVTTDTGGMPEVVADRVNGLLVPQRDPAALADAFGALAADPHLRLELGARAAACARNFDAEAHLDTLEALLIEHASLRS